MHFKDKEKHCLLNDRGHASGRRSRLRRPHMTVIKDDGDYHFALDFHILSCPILSKRLLRMFLIHRCQSLSNFVKTPPLSGLTNSLIETPIDALQVYSGGEKLCRRLLTVSN